jgi:hypothetical protein
MPLDGKETKELLRLEAGKRLEAGG